MVLGTTLYWSLSFSLHFSYSLHGFFSGSCALVCSSGAGRGTGTSSASEELAIPISYCHIHLRKKAPSPPTFLEGGVSVWCTIAGENKCMSETSAWTWQPLLHQCELGKRWWMLGMLLEGIDFFHLELPFIYKKSIPAFWKDHIHNYRVILQNCKFRVVFEFSDVCYYSLSVPSIPLKYPFC